MDRNSVRVWLIPSLGLAGGGPPDVGHAPWESWDRETMGRAYNAAAAVPESAAMFKAWVERSKAFRAAHADHLDLRFRSRGPYTRHRRARTC
jgi:hypothetical protein